MSEGLLGEYGLDLNEIDVPSFEVPDGFYEWVIGDVYLKLGTANHPDWRWIIVSFNLDNGKKYDNWTRLPEDANNPTDKEKDALGRYKGLLIQLGFEPEETNNVGRDDLIGLSGSFKLVTTAGKQGGTFQNIRNMIVGDASDGDSAAHEEAQAVVAAKPVVRRQRAAKPAAAPVVDTQQAIADSEDDEGDEPVAEEAEVAEAPKAAPVRRTPAKAAAAVPAAARTAGARANPFA